GRLGRRRQRRRGRAGRGGQLVDPAVGGRMHDVVVEELGWRRLHPAADVPVRMYRYAPCEKEPKGDQEMRASVVAMVVCLLGFQSGGRADGPKTATAGQLLITEFRLHGPGGPQDEYIEIYNSSASDHTVAAASGTGYGIAASDGLTRCSIPNGTVIPNRGHYLCVNSAGYSVGSYPAGSGATATGDASYTTDIPDNAGIAIFNNNTGGGSYTPANRLDAVGSTSEANATY